MPVPAQARIGPYGRPSCLQSCSPFLSSKQQMIEITAPVERTPDIQRERVVVAGGAWVGQRSGFIGVAWSVWRSCSESQRLAGSGWLAGRQAAIVMVRQSRARLNNGTRPHYCNTANQLDYNTWHGRRSSTRLTTLPLTITITIPLETAGQLGRRAGVRALRMYVCAQSSVLRGGPCFQF